MGDGKTMHDLGSAGHTVHQADNDAKRTLENRGVFEPTCNARWGATRSKIDKNE